MTATISPNGLSRKEEALWLFQRFAPTVAVDNVALAIRTSARLDPATVTAATRLVIHRYPALRTRFPARHGAPRREILDPTTAPVPVSGLSVATADLPPTLTRLALKPFDLTRELPVRVHHVDLHEGGSVLCLVAHHIAFDGASAATVMPELATACARLLRAGSNDGDAPTAAGLGSDEQPATADGFVEPAPSAESLRYWLDALAGVDPTQFAVSAARPEPPNPTFAGARFELDLARPTLAAVSSLRTRLRVTDNMVLLAAYVALLARHGAGPDLVVGVPVDRRPPTDRGRVGFHISTLPLRVRVDLARGFRDLATAVRDALIGGLTHADVSFESLLGELPVAPGSWRAPMFRHLFNFLPPATVAPPGELPDAAWVTVDPGTSRYDLQFIMLRSPDRVALQVAYSTEIHDEAYVRALVDRYELLLAGAAADPDRPLAELDLWRDEDRRIVAAANAGASAPVAAPTVPALVARRLAESAQAPALIEPDGTVHTRLAVAGRAAALRQALRDAGVQAGDVVALAAPRGMPLAAAALAAWSLRAAYLPLDPAQPPARLVDLLERSGARVVVTAAPLPAEALADRHHLPLSTVDDRPDAVDDLADGWSAVEGDDLAYVIFTSGSTGRPKGVEVTHRNLANVVRHFATELGLTSDQRVLWLTSFGFDISALELTLALAHGGGVVVAPDEAQTRPALLIDLVQRHDVAVVQATPTIWRLVAPTLVGGELAGRTLLCGGEPLSAALAHRLLRSGGRLFNVYGPTETTIWSTSALIEPGVTDPVPVGRPIAETALHVLDEHGHECPPGIVGELCISGTGVARGYRGEAELTAERFPTDAQRGRYYRTGDLATWRPDGMVTLLGRADRQIKLRGRRIELGEIEAVLEQHPAVAAAAVVVVGDPQADGRLIGYLQPAGPAVDLDDVRGHLRATLPPYLHPAQLVVLAALPRNPSGKVDYRALPEVAPPPPESAEQPTTADPLVAQLVTLWREVLDQPDLGPESNFFTSGGHSLLAAILAARAGEELGRTVSLLDVFDAPTPVALAALLRAPRDDDATVTADGPGADVSPATTDTDADDREVSP